MRPRCETIRPRSVPATRWLASACAALLALAPVTPAHAAARTVRVRLSEWNVALSATSVPPGRVTFAVANTGSVPHAFEVEGRGIEHSTPQIAPGDSARVTVDLPAGRYEAYCPIGKGSHRMLGMLAHFTVSGGRAAHARVAAAAAPRVAGAGDDHDMDEHGMMAMQPVRGPQAMRLAGGGPVIQILPGPYPFADSAAAIIAGRPPDQREDLTKKAHMGPYSNNVAAIAGDIAILAIDRGAHGDSVSGTAAFTTQDGARWKLVMDRVQTRDIPFNPRFGGVIMGLFYHGASGVHTPLVPTIQSSLALWAYARLERDGVRVSDDAMVHIMLLSRTRRPGDWALDCWDCSARPIEELQLQVTPSPGEPAFDAPGGFLFVNWEKSSGRPVTIP